MVVLSFLAEGVLIGMVATEFAHADDRARLGTTTHRSYQVQNAESEMRKYKR